MLNADHASPVTSDKFVLSTDWASSHPAYLHILCRIYFTFIKILCTFIMRSNIRWIQYKIVHTLFTGWGLSVLATKSGRYKRHACKIIHCHVLRFVNEMWISWGFMCGYNNSKTVLFLFLAMNILYLFISLHGNGSAWLCIGKKLGRCLVCDIIKTNDNLLYSNDTLCTISNRELYMFLVHIHIKLVLKHIDL